MGYVGVSRAWQEALVYTDSTKKLGEALDRRVDKAMGLEAISQNRLKAKAGTPVDSRGKSTKSYVTQERMSAQNVAAPDVEKVGGHDPESNRTTTLMRPGRK